MCCSLFYHLTLVYFNTCAVLSMWMQAMRQTRRRLSISLLACSAREGEGDRERGRNRGEASGSVSDLGFIGAVVTVVIP